MDGLISGTRSVNVWRQLAEYDSGINATTVENYLENDSFGDVAHDGKSAIDHLLTYTSRERDTETSLHFYRARYYDPIVGRFISEDPIGFEANDANLNRYVGNSTVKHKDPSGRKITEAEIASALERLNSDEFPDREEAHRQLVEKVQTGSDIFQVARFIDVSCFRRNWNL